MKKYFIKAKDAILLFIIKRQLKKAKKLEQVMLKNVLKIN